jgi:hypothetical protein
MDASPRNSMRLLMPEAQAQLHSHLLTDPAGGSPHRSNPVAPASHHGHKSIERKREAVWGCCSGCVAAAGTARRRGSTRAVAGVRGRLCAVGGFAWLPWDFLGLGGTVGGEPRFLFC